MWLEQDARLSRAEYWYTPAIHFAVREGHVAGLRLGELLGLQWGDIDGNEVTNEAQTPTEGIESGEPKFASWNHTGDGLRTLDSLRQTA